MEQYFTDYKNWEDWQNGMYENKPKNETNISLAISVLRHPKEHMEMVIEKWPISTKVNLTNTSSNRKSWLGQAACCIAYGIPEDITRKAWMLLTDEERENANFIAKTTIEKWEKSQLV